MSETTETQASAETETQAPPAAAPAPEATTEASETAAEPAAPAPGDEPWRKVRIEQMSREKNEAKRAQQLAERERDEARKIIEELRAGQSPDTAGMSAAQIQAEARRLATEELAARDQDSKNEIFVKAGRAAFTDFDDRCAVVASAGATARPEFMAIIGDMDDGPRVVMHLADHPTEAVRILNLPAHKMGLELAKIERSVQPRAAAPKPVSQLPKPVTPLGGVTASDGDIFDPNISMAEYTRLRQKQIAAKEAQRR